MISKLLKISKDRLFASPAGVELANPVLVDIALRFCLLNGKSHGLPECVIGRVLHKSFPICLFNKVRTALGMQGDGSDDLVIADSLGRNVDSSPAKFKPIIAGLAKVIYAHPVPIDPHATHTIQK
mgnify:CR=1 FL=1